MNRVLFDLPAPVPASAHAYERVAEEEIFRNLPPIRNTRTLAARIRNIFPKGKNR